MLPGALILYLAPGVKKNTPQSAAKKTAKAQRRRRRTSAKASATARRTRDMRKTLRLTPAGRYALLDPSDPSWSNFKNPVATQAMMQDLDLDDPAADRWLDQLVAWGYAKRREGKRGAEFAITEKGIAWVEAGLPPMPEDRGSRVAVETVLGDGSDISEFFAAHNRSTHRDDILVVATWFRMREKDTFMPVDVEMALERLGRPYPAKNVQEALSSEMEERGEVLRTAHGVYRVTAQGIARAKGLLTSAEAPEDGPSTVTEAPPSDDMTQKSAAKGAAAEGTSTADPASAPKGAVTPSEARPAADGEGEESS